MEDFPKGGGEGGVLNRSCQKQLVWTYICPIVLLFFWGNNSSRCFHLDSYRLFCITQLPCLSSNALKTPFLNLSYSQRKSWTTWKKKITFQRDKKINILLGKKCLPNMFHCKCLVILLSKPFWTGMESKFYKNPGQLEWKNSYFQPNASSLMHMWFMLSISQILDIQH